MLWALLSITLLGILLLAPGLRGRRIQTSPSCRRCRFTLAGIEVERCPECGAMTSRRGAVRTQRRVPRWRLVVPGLIILLPAAFGIGYFAGVQNRDFEINLQHHKPAMLLCLENRFAEGARADAALREIQRRLRAEELTKRGMRSVAGHVLRIQADTEREWDTKWGDLMDRAREQGILRDRHWKRYTAQGYHPVITPRSVVRVGDPLTYMIEDNWRFGQAPPLAVVLIVGNAVIGDTSPPTHEAIRSAADAGEVHAFLVRPTGNAAFRTKIMSEHRSYGGPRPILPRPTVPGRTVLRVPVRLEYYDLPRAERIDTRPSRGPVRQLRARASPVLSHTLVFAADTNVLPVDVESPTLIDDPDVGERLYAYLDDVLRGPPEGVELAERNRVIARRATELHEGLPVPVAFELIAREGEEEARIGFLRGTTPFGPQRGADFVWFRPLPDHFELKRVDLILRPDLERARHSVELTAIWGTEIVLRDFIIDGWQPPREPAADSVDPMQANDEGGPS